MGADAKRTFDLIEFGTRKTFTDDGPREQGISCAHGSPWQDIRHDSKDSLLTNNTNERHHLAPSYTLQWHPYLKHPQNNKN